MARQDSWSPTHALDTGLHGRCCACLAMVRVCHLHLRPGEPAIDKSGAMHAPALPSAAVHLKRRPWGGIHSFLSLSLSTLFLALRLHQHPGHPSTTRLRSLPSVWPCLSACTRQTPQLHQIPTTLLPYLPPTYTRLLLYPPVSRTKPEHKNKRWPLSRCILSMYLLSPPDPHPFANKLPHHLPSRFKPAHDSPVHVPRPQSRHSEPPIGHTSSLL